MLPKNIRQIILAFAAFFSSWGEGMQHILPHPTLFYIAAVFLLLFINWSLYFENSRTIYDIPKFYKYLLLYVFLHTVLYCILNPEVLAFGREAKRSANDDFVIEQAATGEIIIRYFSYALFSLLLSFLFRERRNLGIFSFFYSIGFSFTIFGGGFSAEYDGLARLSGGMSDPNIMAQDATLALFLSLSFLKNSKLFVKAIYIICSVTALSAILLSFSRGALLALMVCVFLLTFKKIKLYKIIIGGVVVISAIFIMYRSLPSDMRTMIELRFSIEEASEKGGAIRTGIWNEYLKNLHSYFVTGTGISNGQSVLVENHSQEYRVTHNQYLLYLVEFGFIGFALYFLYFIKCWKICMKCIGSKYQLLVMPFIAMSIITVFLNIDKGRSFWIILAIINTIWYLNKNDMFINKKKSKVVAQIGI